MNRDRLLERATDGREHDLIVIGGGATGLGVAVEAASRGYDTLLLEQADFAQGTSSRSTKLIHGGVRYLKQGNISLVLEALHERGLLIRLGICTALALNAMMFAFADYFGMTASDGVIYTLASAKRAVKRKARTLQLLERCRKINGVARTEQVIKTDAGGIQGVHFRVAVESADG